jgi:tRNA1(Val) A37 N6-methylase TrmN6
MAKWGISPLSNTEKRDLSNPNFLKIKLNPQEYKEEVFSLTREKFCKKYNITISQYNNLKKILNIPKNRSGFSKWRNTKFKKLSENQIDLIIASMLGDGSFRKLKHGVIYKEFHSFKQLSYLYRKSDVLSPFIDKIYPEGNGFILQTVPLKELDYLFDLFYPDGSGWKQVPDKIIENFKLEWLGYWYLDDGTLADNTPRISNHFLSQKNLEVLSKKLLKNEIEISISPSFNYFSIKKVSSKKFFDMVSKFATSDMQYKIPNRYQVKSNKIDNEDTLKKQWEILYNMGFPYPSLTKQNWLKRFKSLLSNGKVYEEYKKKENTSLMCNIFYPQMYNHLLKVFQNKEKVINNRVAYADRVTPASMLTGLKLMSKETRTNFSPLMAKMIIDKFSDNRPKNILDYSMGFGGRLLGTMSAKMPHQYFGIEPWKENILSAEKMLDFIEEVIPDSKKRFKTYNQGSEILIPSLEDKIDIAFSSPPYFNYEKYVDEDTQCYNKYPNYADWLEKYWDETVKNIQKYLKKDGLLILNIKNVKKYNLQKDMVDIIEKNGLVLQETLDYSLSGRYGNFKKDKTEPIYVFKKP